MRNTAVSDPGADWSPRCSPPAFAYHRFRDRPLHGGRGQCSGLIDGPFLTLGFLPRGRGERLQLVARAATAGVPLVIFESAPRLERTLRELTETLGERRAVVLRELTKIHEEVRAGSLSELSQWATEAAPRGEMVGEAATTEAAASNLTPHGCPPT